MPQPDQIALGRGAAAFNGYLLRIILATVMTDSRWSPPRLLRVLGLQQAAMGAWRCSWRVELPGLARVTAGVGIASGSWRRRGGSCGWCW